MIIKNGVVFQEDKTFVKKDLYIEKGRIAASEDQVTEREVIDAEGLFVLPGLIDIHSHGAAGHDFSDGDTEGLKEILAYEYRHGVTSYCPTTMTMEADRLLQILHKMNDWRDEEGMAHMAGIHMEGPFLDAAKKGAHREACILPPDVDFFQKCSNACGKRIRLITLAPNTDGAVEFIRSLKDDVVLSLGHTAADYDTARQALEAGANHITHLFNAMNPLEHRAPGLIGAASEREDCMAELICDGVHVHESMVRAAFRLFPGRIVLISDSIRATGMQNGICDLGGQPVAVSGNRATLADGTIAGSVTNLFDCMRTAVSFGIPMEEAIAAATVNPAKSIGISHMTGSLTPGKQADVILTDKNLNLIRVL